MTDRAIPHAEWDLAATDLTGAHAAVLVTTGPGAAQPAAALTIARAAARSGRRVALIDLSLEQPRLTAGTDVPGGEGIVDAFLFGASLQHVAAEQDVPGLFVIGAGTQVPDPSAVWSHERWQRLANGFAAEGALLLLFTPIAALAHLALRPDRVLVLGPVDAAVRGALDGLAGRGVRLDRVRLPEEAVPPPDAPVPGTARVPRHLQRRPRSRTTVLALGGVTIILGALIAGLLMVRGRPPDPPTPAPSATAPAPAVVPEAAPPPDEGTDSLFYALQVAAFQTAENALERADEYVRAGWVATVSPVRLGRQGTWHRLIVGAFREAAAAEQALQRLWDDGILERPSGTILRTPYALALGTYADSAAAAAAVAGLRAEGIAAYIVGSPEGPLRIYAGAFESPEQAARADSMIHSAGVTATVVARLGVIP